MVIGLPQLLVDRRNGDFATRTAKNLSKNLLFNNRWKPGDVEK